ncbi:hypothetical protein BDV29DRAFT_160704 [Aspergillus leporis]|uniref:Uncharacterized protein n=1 Tax=Aspergillus leporis TaxID=41062 RepID=A0A5N5WSN5_9EURO|nr:hypothetical protein BDV29DRAFT_160704 [Aspergillus leporis]
MAKTTYGEPVDISDSGVSRAIEEEPVELPGQAMDLNLAKEKRDKNKNAVNKIASLQLEDETAKHTRYTLGHRTASGAESSNGLDEGEEGEEEKLHEDDILQEYVAYSSGSKRRDPLPVHILAPKSLTLLGRRRYMSAWKGFHSIPVITQMICLGTEQNGPCVPQAAFPSGEASLTIETA